jgi:hypothetical protein
MSTVQIELSSEQLLAAVKQLPPEKLKEFQQQFTVWQKRNGQAGEPATEKETELLDRIRLNSRLPEAAHRRFQRLRRKLQEETISERELQELQGLTSRLEWMSVERLEALVELAHLRGTDLDTLMRELGLLKKRRAY